MSAIAAITSAALLYKASLPLLHGKSSFSGQTPFEAAFRVTRRRYVFAGMIATAIAVLCSLHQDRITQPLVDERRVGP